MSAVKIMDSKQFCAKSTGDRHPLFFIGSSPSMASRIISPDYPAAGVMVSVNQLSRRKSDFAVGDWIMDSGAFTEVARYGGYRSEPIDYYQQIFRWEKCGNLLIAVAQDWMCEPFVLERTGLSVAEHQKLTIERYDQLHILVKGAGLKTPLMPVLQGYRVADYLEHLDQYCSNRYYERLPAGAWIGIGSVCRRNGHPSQIADILKSIKNKRPDLRLHGFGLKQTALENAEVRDLLYSCDSTAWSYARRFHSDPGPDLSMAHDYQHRIHAAATDSVQKRIPRTAGAGNGQGRKPKWSSPTTVIRVPAKFADELIQIAKGWDSNEPI